MTALVAPPRAEASGATDAVVEVPGAPMREARKRVMRAALAGLVVVVIGWGAFALFEGPVAQTWNRNRQHQLAAELLQSRPHTGAGAAIAVFQIPKLGINQVVAEGDAPQQLRSGPGHRIGTPQPGAVGNSVITGHRTGWGGAFRDLGSVKKGDLIVVQTQDAAQGPRNGVFKVISVQRVATNDLRPFGGATDRRLTIVTGTGGQLDGDQRLVVTAVSGTVRKALPAKAGVSTTTAAGSRLWNASMLVALFGIGGALLVGLIVRRRYGRAVVAAVVVPLALLGLCGLFLNLDLFLPPLR